MKSSLFLITTLSAWLVISCIGARAVEKQWNGLLNKARTEGIVVLGSSHTAPSFRQAVTSTFFNRFNIRVDVKTHRSGELGTIIGRECAAGRPSIDVVMSGLSEVLGLHSKEKSCYSPIKSALILPEVTDVRQVEAWCS